MEMELRFVIGFQAPFSKFELANFAKEAKVDLVVCSVRLGFKVVAHTSLKTTMQMNWLKSDEIFENDADEWDRVAPTISYFVTRLTPILQTSIGFVACNRIGTECVSGASKNTTFTGSSCIVSLDEQPTVLAHAGPDREKMIIANLEIP